MAENGYRMITLHGVAKRNVRFYTDVQGNEMANVAVPWKDSKSGMGNIDVRAQDVRQEKSSYAIDLPKEQYGVWHVNKDGHSDKPLVRSGRIFAVYEDNRQSYRKNRISGKQNVSEDKPKDEVSNSYEDDEMLDFG